MIFDTSEFGKMALTWGATKVSLHRHGWWRIKFDDGELTRDEQLDSADLFREYCAEEKYEVRGTSGVVLVVRL